MVSQAEPAIPHAAACFARIPTPGEPGRFEIIWATYLPVKSPAEPEANLRSPDLVTLTLHGRFFVDAGRVGIDFGDPDAPADSRTVRQQWNDLLRDDGTLDLIIPALEEFATAPGTEDSPGLVRGLVETLQGSPLFRRFRGLICRRHQWVYLVGREGARWGRLEAGDHLHAIPEPTRADPPLTEVFPRLPMLDKQDARLTYQDWPSLRSSDELLPWPENALLSLLKTGQNASFSDPARMGLMVRTLRVAMGNRCSSAVVDRLVQIAREGMDSLGFAGVVLRREMIAPFLDLIPADRKLRVYSGESLEEIIGPLLTPLWSNGWTTLVVPFGSGNARSSLTEREAMVGRLLALEPETATGPFLEARAHLACQIVQSGEYDRDAAWAGFEDRAIFPASCQADGSPTLVTRAFLATAHRASQLLVDHLGLAGAFRDALDVGDGHRFTTISRNLADTAFGKGSVPDASATACLVALAARPRLTSDVKRRITLINRLIASPGLLDDGGNRLPFRYLLHADAAHFDDAATLLVESEADGDEVTVWREMAARALRQDDAAWRLVPALLVARLNAEQRGQLGLHPINRPGVVRLLRDVGPGRLDLSDLTDEDVRMILEDCRPDDFAVIRGLPIHRTVSGSRVAIDDHCHWRGDFKVEGDIAASVTVLVPHPDKAIAQKQQQIHTNVLDARGALRLILGGAGASQSWRTILEALTSLGSLPGNLSMALRGTRWVPIAPDRAIRPDQVIRVGSKDQAIHDILRTVERTSEDVVSFFELPEPFRKHRIFDRLLLAEGDALEKLGQILGRDPRYRIGGLDRGQARTDPLRLLFDDAPPSVMPCYPLLKDEPSRGGTRSALDSSLTERLIPHLLGAVPTDRAVAILNFLADRHRSAAVAEKDRYLDAFCHYLEAATRADQNIAALPGLSLPSQAGTWSTADRLTMGATHIVPSSMLHRRLEQILADHADRSDRRSPAPPGDSAIEAGNGTGRGGSYLEAERRSVAALADYLEEWTTAARPVPRELVGGLLALLGDSEPMLEAARRFLGNHDLFELRNKLRWDSSAKFISGGVEQGGSGQDIHQTMKALRVFGKLSEGDTVELTNLLGDPIEVMQARDYDHLVLSSHDLNPGVSPRHLTLQLRRGNPRLIPSDLDPAAVLRLTARQVLRAVDKMQKIPNFDQVWEALARSEQLDLEVAQRYLLDGMVNTMQMLGLRNRPPLDDSIRRWHEANRSLVQLEAGDARRRDELEKRKQSAREAIRELMETDGEVQRHCLEVVRFKLGTFEYTAGSIPFELFQNADDAVTEWLALEGSDHPADSGRLRFEVEVAGRTIRFSSWGRAINHHQRGDVDGRQWGYDQDVEKMLTLNWSDKGRDERTTGKFGLGFKSVLLATERPRVVSGRLAFEVVGGLYPVRLDEEARTRLTTLLAEQNPEESGGTVVELPLDGIDAEVVLDRFRKLHPFLGVFGRQIRICKVMSPDGRSVTSEWKPDPLGGNPDLEIGELNGVGRLLVLRGESATLALLVTPEGISKLPDHVPTVWVTAPTQQRANLGFAINAPFTLDIGRLQLAHTSNANNDVADRAGRELGDLLLALFHLAEADWPRFQGEIGLGETVTPYQFWGSLWNLLTRPLANNADPLISLLRRMFWGEGGHGMRALMRHAAVIPSGLPNSHARLIRLRDIRSTTSGLLGNDRIFGVITSWPKFQSKYPPGSIVSGRTFLDLKGLLKADLQNAEIVSLATIHPLEVDDEQRVAPESAARLGRLISPQSLETWGTAGPVGLKERGALVDELKRIRFRAGDGRWQLSAELVIRPGRGSGQADDDGLQAGFAPERSVLNSSYSGDALTFFKACRPSKGTPASTLADWAIEAGGPARRLALDYIIRGAMAHDLAGELTRRGKAHWIGQLDESGLLSYGFDAHQSQVILGRLRLSRPLPSPGVLQAPEPPNPRVALERIHQWWEEHRIDAVKDYERRWYPQSRFPGLAADLDRQSAAEQRKGWMILLMLGAMHTIGRVRPEAHRGFLDLCEEKGWLDTFSSPTDQLDTWMKVLIDYLDRNVADSPYLHWMGRFAGIFQLAHWLPDYVESYLAIGRVKEPFELGGILNLRTSSLMQGSGRDAPPVTRTLGIGACFVIRELVRNGHLANNHAHRHCYVPTARVRGLLTRLGCPGLEDGYRSAGERIKASATIHRYLVQHLGEPKSTFHGDFDLPFVALSEPKYRPDCERILGSGVDEDLDEDTEEEVF